MKKSYLEDMPMPSAAPKKKSPFPPAAAPSAPEEEGDDISAEDLEMPAEGEMDAEPGPFADASDEDLLAEAKKRGLQVTMPEPEEGADDFSGEELELGGEDDEEA